jgi:hypothetical protein
MRTRVLPFLLLTVILAGGCASDSKKKEPDPDPSLYLPQTSIANVLANLKRGYQEKNYGEYRKLLDAPFEYVFAPQDVGGPNNIPGSWGLADELTSANNMFSGLPNRDNYWADTIKLVFTAGADTPTDLNPNWRKVVLSNVNLEIESREMTSSDPLTYQIIGDKAELYFVQTDETAPGTDLRIWKIIRWDDKPISYGIAISQDFTWGQIKANFH